MSLALLIFTVILAHCAYGGTRLNISLAALSAGASPLTVGVMMSLIAALPMLLGVAAGQLIDRIGVRVPMIAGVSILIVAVALPGLSPGVASLLFSAAGIGAGFMLFQICAQHMVGEMSTDEDRRDNFGWLALGFATSNFIGPSVAGIAIDRLGHDETFLVFAGSAAASLLTLVLRRASLTHRPHAAKGPPRSAWDLMRDAKLRRVFIISGLLASAWDLFVFIMPIYGTSIGLNATTIGLILASFAAATFTVRLMLPILSRMLREWTLITITFAVALVAYLAFPMVRTVPLLSSIAFLLGLGLGATQPSIMALVYSTAPQGRAGEAVGVRTVVLNASHTVLPLVFGAMGTVLGSMLPVFWAMSVALAGGGWLAHRTRRDERFAVHAHR
jgi:predicted MFS family arabinose efflux permease